MLVVFGGLPGTGKTTIARLVAKQCSATYLRIDVIEQAIRDSGFFSGEMGPMGYCAAYALAESNLNLGRTIIADSVNPLPVTRDAWRAVAQRCACPILEVEIVCSDEAEHRKRVENRESDISGFVLPDWGKVVSRDYEPWPDVGVVIDTAHVLAEEAAAVIVDAMKTRGW